MYWHRQYTDCWHPYVKVCTIANRVCLSPFHNCTILKYFSKTFSWGDSVHPIISFVFYGEMAVWTG